MCFESMAWAVKQKTANSGQKLVLLMLADFANSETGQCNPSHQKLADRCCMSVASIKRHIDDLEAAGLLQKVNVFRDNIQRANQYVLALPGLSVDNSRSLNLSYPPAHGELQNLEVKPININTSKVVKPESVSEAVWQDFCTHRKQKKALITQRVVDSIAEQASSAGWTLEQAMTEMVSRNWMGFKAEWVQSKTSTAKQETPEERRKRLAFL